MRRAALAWVVMCVSIGCEEGNPGGSTIANEDDGWEQWSEQICQQQAGCSCADMLGAQECKDALAVTTEEFRAIADELELTFDGSCFQVVIDRTRDLGCLTIDELAAMSSGGGGAHCKLYYGTKRLGDACETAYAFDECQQGLFCLDDVCVDYSGTAQEGEPCYGADAVGPCAQGLVCRVTFEPDNDVPTSICYRPARIGEACLDYGCEDGLVCDTAQDACRVAPGVGEPCFESQCDEASRCDFETDPASPLCIDRLADGAMCEVADECASNDCGEQNTCVPEQAWVCELSSSLQMPEG